MCEAMEAKGETVSRKRKWSSVLNVVEESEKIRTKNLDDDSKSSFGSSTKAMVISEHCKS